MSRAPARSISISTSPWSYRPTVGAHYRGQISHLFTFSKVLLLLLLL